MEDTQPISGDAWVTDRRPCLVSKAANHRVERLRSTRHLAGSKPGEGTDGTVRAPGQWTLPGGTIKRPEARLQSTDGGSSCTAQ